MNAIPERKSDDPVAEDAASGRGFVCHFVTNVCTTALLAMLPLVMYCAWVFPFAKSAADLGGPLNFVIIPLMGATGGFLGSLIIFLPLSLVAQRKGLHLWVRRSGISAALLLLIIVGAWLYNRFYVMEPRTIPIVLAASMLLYWVGGFFAYLCGLAACRKILL